MSIYNSVVKQGESPKRLEIPSSPPLCTVTKLNAIRDEQTQAQTSSLSSSAAASSSINANASSSGTAEPNRVDTIIADVFGLLSLFFLTIGKSRETPATYSQIASMRVSAARFSRSLSHLRADTSVSKSSR